MATPLRSAVILAVGSELTTGSTLDTNSGDLAGELSAMGVEVLYVTDLPDRLERVSAAIAGALAQAELVISTGGLGPTPDDLTREAIAAAVGLDTHVDPVLERWLRTLFRRRGLEMPDSNLKQAWLVPGATALRNGHGTAPGWWLELGGDKVLVALPGPPREMWPMWREQVRPRLAERGVGSEIAVRTLRLTGIGESALVELIGEEVLRQAEPEVATYARADAVDVRLTAHGEDADARVTTAVEQLLPRLERYVFGRDTDTWPDVIGRLLGARTLATVESGTGGQLVALLGESPFLARGEVVRDGETPAAELAERVRSASGADIGLGLRATVGEVDTAVEIAIADTGGVHVTQRTAFLAGVEGRRRAALSATMTLWEWLARQDGRALPS